jgi:hypothetical protein
MKLPTPHVETLDTCQSLLHHFSITSNNICYLMSADMFSCLSLNIECKSEDTDALAAVTAANATQIRSMVK